MAILLTEDRKKCGESPFERIPFIRKDTKEIKFAKQIPQTELFMSAQADLFADPDPTFL
jgi:hypothetical protein